MENEREDGGSEETRKMRPLGRESQPFVYYSLTCFLFLLFFGHHLYRHCWHGFCGCVIVPILHETL